jgi:hypothetical protein
MGCTSSRKVGNDMQESFVKRHNAKYVTGYITIPYIHPCTPYIHCTNSDPCLRPLKCAFRPDGSPAATIDSIYTPVSELGEGAFGSVFLAKHNVTGTGLTAVLYDRHGMCNSRRARCCSSVPAPAPRH